MSQADLAERMGRPAKTISEIINGVAAVTPETALQLDRVLGVPAESWIIRESQYRIWLAASKEREWLTAGASWVRRFPYAKLARWGCVIPSRDPAARTRALLQFFGVASPEQWDQIWGDLFPARFRLSLRADTRLESVSAWLRAGEIESAALDCAPYDPVKFRAALHQARQLTGEKPDSFLEKLTTLCAGAGVAVVFIPALPGCPVSGATRWTSPRTALIQLSARYLTNDHLWFTFFHEAGHILLHGKKRRFLETSKGHLWEDSASSQEEDEADRFAAEFLMPRALVEQVRERPPRTERELRELARQCGIHAGVVVGRLQHEGVLPYSRGNALKIRFRWEAAPPRWPRS